MSLQCEWCKRASSSLERRVWIRRCQRGNLLRPARLQSANLTASPARRLSISQGNLLCRSHAGEPLEDNNHDSNQLQTAFNNAIASEDYTLAARLRDRLSQVQGKADVSLDWRALGVLHWLAERTEQLGFKYPTDVQRRVCQAFQRGATDLVVQSQTGSGKTLAFLLPLLSRLSYPPDVFPEDLEGPQLIILVPSMELGVQEAMLVYKLFGGSVNPGIPGASANMFAYTGPRGLKVRGLLSQEEVAAAAAANSIRGAHVLVATPARLAEALRLPGFRGLFSDLRGLVLDEVDACFEVHTQDVETVLRESCSQMGRQKPAVVFVGATLSESLARQASQMGWMHNPTVVLPPSKGVAGVPSGLRHSFIRAEPKRKLAVLCRQLRADVEAHGQDAPPPRVVVFAGSEEAALAAVDPLRTALWGQHRLAALLPHGEEPIKARLLHLSGKRLHKELALQAFRDNTATFLLATPAAARGLDLPAITHVYNLDCCEDATDYLHRAGRAGRIGSPVSGMVTSIVSAEEEPRLRSIAAELGVGVAEQAAAAPAPASGADVDAAKQELEDLYNLM